MKKFLYILIFPLILSGCLWSESLPQITIDDKNRNFNFELDQEFQIVLAANHTTGYQWLVDDITDGALEYLTSDYHLSDEYDETVVGAGGEEILTFKVTNVQRSHIILKYARSWDEQDIESQFLVTINGNPGDDGLLTYYGTIHSTSEGAQWNDFFKVAEGGEEFGIEPLMIVQIADPGIKARISEYTDNDQIIEIRGKMIEDVPDYGGKQFIIHEINFVGA